MFKDPVLRTISILMIPVIILYGLYIQFHGDYSPGGGFQAGVIVASAIVLYGILFGLDATLKAISPYTIKVIGGLGILVYGGTGIASMLFHGEFLSYSVLMNDSILGQKLGIFVVELGVGMTVCSSMLTIYFNFVSWCKE
ncbi:MAG: Na(+)/H(+) antiporter subunit B [Ehrlichia sp.]